MSTTPNAKSHSRTAKSAPLQPKGPNIDELHPDVLRQLIDLIKPITATLKPTEKEHEEAHGNDMNDLTFQWEVKLIRGRDTVFAKTRGISSLNYIFGPSMLSEAVSIIDNEIREKIASPLVKATMDFVSRDALERRAAREAESGLSD